VKSMVLTPTQWQALQERISAEYPPSVCMVRSRKRSVLGFTERHHRRWLPGVPGSVGYYQVEVHLDFFDDAKRSFFVLKYGDLLND